MKSHGTYGVGSCRVGLGRGSHRIVSSPIGSGRIGSGSFQHLTGRVGLGNPVRNLTGQVGSGQELFKTSRVGSGSDLTRSDPREEI